MHNPSWARVMATFTWLGSVMKPRCFACQALPRLEWSFSTEGSQVRTVEKIIYGHSLPEHTNTHTHMYENCMFGLIFWYWHVFTWSRNISTIFYNLSYLLFELWKTKIQLTLAFHDGTCSQVFNAILSQFCINFSHLCIVWCKNSNVLWLNFWLFDEEFSNSDLSVTKQIVNISWIAIKSNVNWYCAVSNCLYVLYFIRNYMLHMYCKIIITYFYFFGITC